VAVVESEGNGRMCLTLPETLITVMGIEKVVPAFTDLEVFLQLLPRSSTGERMNPYTSMWTGVTPGDGPQQFHLVLLDNGRTQTLSDPVGRQALACIRCSACMNVCPALAAAQRAGAIGARLIARKGTIGRLPGPLSGWSDARDTVAPASESFRAWWRRTGGGKQADGVDANMPDGQDAANTESTAHGEPRKTR
jgi:L-lactate dehydrogenase complex protein LldF